jgi:hypothetical protein
MLSTFNNIAGNLKFSIEGEKNNVISFLDITIRKQNNQFQTDIYRKPTATDCIIPNGSCHPHEHKTATIQYFANGIATYPLSTIEKEREIKVVKNIMSENRMGILLHIQKKDKTGNQCIQPHSATPPSPSHQPKQS